MKTLIILLIRLLFTFTLTGCIGEDYDVGVPTAHLYLDNSNVQLTEANISWDTASEDVQRTIELELNESREFLFPNNTGNYVLEVALFSSVGKAQ